MLGFALGNVDIFAMLFCLSNWLSQDSQVTWLELDRGGFGTLVGVKLKAPVCGISLNFLDFPIVQSKLFLSLSFVFGFRL